MNKKRRGKIKIKSKQEVRHYIPYLNYIPALLLLSAFALSLFMRTVMPYDSVFRNNVVAFASDDAVYHMRLVENTLHHFPYRISYDPLTHYPYGSLIHFGPLWTQLIATLSLIAGLGSYDMHTTNIIGAFIPSVFGALVVFPVYYIGRSLGNKGTGILAAFMIAILPGQFFERSTLGFTDHHVAEVLFSTATLAFYILALKSGREENVTFNNIKHNVLIYSLLAGVMLSAYQLSWVGAPFFAMIILLFLIIQYIIDNIKGKTTDYLAIVTIPIFVIDLISVIPYLNIGYGFATFFYSWFHVSVAIAGIALPLILSIISKELTKRGVKTYYYPVSIIGFFALGMLVMKVIIPGMYNAIVNAPRTVFAFPTGGLATVAEASSILEHPGMIWDNFPVTGFLQKDSVVLLFVIATLSAIGYNIIKKQRGEDVLFIVWSVVILLAIFGQNRWAYYFAVNIAIMVGYLGCMLSERILRFGGWEYPFKNINTNHILSLVLVVMLILFFTYPSFASTLKISRWGGGEPSGGGFNEWYEALTWMRNNTPDPGMDYYAIYKKPNRTYPYPDTAYGVMSWWDYGHIITYWAHRIPNANPFQEGIGGGKNHVPGASTFLTAKSEEEANKVLNALGVNGKPGARYVITNGYMAYQIMQVFGIWNEDYGYYTQIQTSKGTMVVPSRKYYETMASKLHIFDGNGLKHYRLVHESPPNPYTQGGYPEQFYKKAYNILYGGNLKVENTGVVKIFEYVKGARITGKAPPNTTITITNTIKTNIGRSFTYTQTTYSNGSYTFIVPYSTTPPLPNQTQFDTKAIGNYTITYNNISKQVSVSERDVLEGRTINLDLI